MSPIWAAYCRERASGNILTAANSKVKEKSGRKRQDRDQALTKVRSVPVEDRQNTRQAAAASGLTRYMVSQLVKEGHVKRRAGRIKPVLTDEHKYKRIEHALCYIDETTPTFEPMVDVVHVDEKWFNADKDVRHYLLCEGEKVPHRTQHSKRFIPKTMFLAAVARPRFDPHRKGVWDGKLGIWPFAEWYKAKRTTKNHVKGSIYLRNIETVDTEVYKRYLLTYVYPANKEKWPHGDSKLLILIQQDNAKPHVSPFDPDIVKAGSEGGWNIRLGFQPPNPPDMNVLDLGLFASLQFLQYQKRMRRVAEIIDAVNEAYKAMTTETLHNIFLTLQNCMVSVLKANGGNDYELPHMGKMKLRRKEMLPECIQCDQDVYEGALATLARANGGSVAFFSPVK